MTLKDLAAQTAQQFARIYGRPPIWIAAAPGRVNLIGEHTDYNDGYVFPMAIERYTVIAADRSASGARLIRLHSTFSDKPAIIDLSRPLKPFAKGTWANYPLGVIAGFVGRKLDPGGFDALVHSTVPLGGGLSSSAALEVGMATLLETITGKKLEPVEKALLCQKAEHEFAGMPCGIMDQFISVMGRENRVMLLDCRSRQPDLVPMSDPSVAVLIINTNIASRLGAGAVSWINYADRLMEFPTALLGVALGTILLPSLSKAHVDADPHEYSALLDWGLRVTFLLAAPSAVALFFFAEPLTATLFHYGKFDANSVVMTARALAAYGVGLVGLILIKILAPGFYARQDIKTPVKIGVGVLVATQISNYIFVPIFSHAGLTLSVGLGACMNALLLFIGLRRRGIYMPSSGWATFFVQLLGACLVLAGAMHWCSISYDWIGLRHEPLARIALLAACLVLFAALYFGMLWLMGFKYAYFKRRAK